MANSTLIRTTLLLLSVVAFGFAATGFAPAQEDRSTPVIQIVGSDSRKVHLYDPAVSATINIRRWIPQSPGWPYVMTHGH